MTASGTAGHGAELAPYVDLGSLGAVVVKSLSAEAWAGNPALRVHETVGGMINSVGLQGPGVEAWLADDLPALAATGARIVASIWGRTRRRVRGGGRPARRRARVGRRRRGEPLLSQHRGRPRPVRPLGDRDPRRDGGHRRRAAAHAGPSSARTSPTWCRSPTPPAPAARRRSRSSTRCSGMAIDPETGCLPAGIRPARGRALGPGHPPDRRAGGPRRARGACPTCRSSESEASPRGGDAAELILAGASAVQVGTATFADPRAPARVLQELEAWAHRTGRTSIHANVGAAHGRETTS